MSFKIKTRGVLVGLVPKAALAFTLLMAVILMIGCKSATEGGSSGSGGSGSSGGSGGGSAGDFEGVVNMTMASSEGKPFQMTYYMKTDRVRMETHVPDTPGAVGVMIMDIPAAKFTSLLTQQKTYITEDLKGMQADTSDAGSDRKFPKLTDTGKKETIAGYTCEHYLIGDEQNMDMCVAKGLGYFGMGGAGGRSGGLKDLLFSAKMKAEVAANPEWSKFLDGGAFPLKMTMTEGGKTTMNAEVTSVERKKLDDSLFTVPPDYKEMKMPAGMPPIPGKPSQ